jgi:hypothetical protein
MQRCTLTRLDRLELRLRPNRAAERLVLLAPYARLTAGQQAQASAARDQGREVLVIEILAPACAEAA